MKIIFPLEFPPRLAHNGRGLKKIATMIQNCHDHFRQSERVSESVLGSDDGKWIFESIFSALEYKTVAVTG